MESTDQDKRKPFRGEEQLCKFLVSIGQPGLADKVEYVKLLNEEELKEMGIQKENRIKILNAVKSMKERQTH